MIRAALDELRIDIGGRIDDRVFNTGSGVNDSRPTDF